MRPIAKHTHYLVADGAVQELDVLALPLMLSSRGSRPLRGDQFRGDRDALAQVVGAGVLAELLLSGRPILVDAIYGGYRIEEV